MKKEKNANAKKNTKGTMPSNQVRRQDGLILILWIVIAALAAGTVVSFTLFHRHMNSILAMADGGTAFRRHFAYVGDPSNSFQNAIYEAASQEAAANGDYVESVGSSLEMSYSLEELMNIAAASAPDGIIVNAIDNADMEEAVNSAAQQNIPVICVGTDIYGSKRSSYVGISYYTLGQAYAQCILPLQKDAQQRVLVIKSPEEHTTGQALILSGLHDALRQSGADSSFSITYQTVGDSKSFSTAEAVEDLFAVGDLPDILICLDETSTTCTCQAVVDTNHVGDVAIFGYYVNDVILDALQKEVISGSLTVSTKEIGKSAVDSLEEYLSTGFTSEYSPIGIESVIPENADAYASDNAGASETESGEETS